VALTPLAARPGVSPEPPGTCPRLGDCSYSTPSRARGLRRYPFPSLEAAMTPRRTKTLRMPPPPAEPLRVPHPHPARLHLPPPPRRPRLPCPPASGRRAPRTRPPAPRRPPAPPAALRPQVRRLYRRPRSPGRLADGLRCHDRGHGVHRRLLDPAL